MRFQRLLGGAVLACAAWAAAAQAPAAPQAGAAQAGVPEAWVADLAGDVVKQYANPMGGVYRFEKEYRRGETLVSHAVPELSVDVVAILG